MVYTLNAIFKSKTTVVDFRNIYHAPNWQVHPFFLFPV